MRGENNMSGNGAAEPPWVKNRIAPEGTDGLYSQTWYPVCRSSDLQPGQIIGKEFLDGLSRIRPKSTICEKAGVYEQVAVQLDKMAPSFIHPPPVPPAWHVARTPREK